MQTMSNVPTTLPDDYPQLLARLKREIGAARTRAALAVNEELIKLYWWIGTEILARQERDGWGGKAIDRLASDLRAEFPEMRGLSVRNLEYMRQFAGSWPDSQIPQQPVAKLPWAQHRPAHQAQRPRDPALVCDAGNLPAGPPQAATGSPR